MPDPLIELALRVQLSGVPPAYGSWLLTPRPPLHEGEKQPVGQETRGIRRSIQQTSINCKGNLSITSIDRRHVRRQAQQPRQRFLEKVKGVGWGEADFCVVGRLNASLAFLPARWVIYGEIGLC
jgi:hypothetical protein